VQSPDGTWQPVIQYDWQRYGIYMNNGTIKQRVLATKEKLDGQPKIEKISALMIDVERFTGHGEVELSNETE